MLCIAITLLLDKSKNTRRKLPMIRSTSLVIVIFPLLGFGNSNATRQIRSPFLKLKTFSSRAVFLGERRRTPIILPPVPAALKAGGRAEKHGDEEVPRPADAPPQLLRILAVVRAKIVAAIAINRPCRLELTLMMKCTPFELLRRYAPNFKGTGRNKV